MNITSLLQQAGIGVPPTPAPAQAAGQGGSAFAALSGALNAGDVSGAQNAFASLKNLLISAGSIGAANSVQNDFVNLGKALGSGDLTGAKKGLQQLQSDSQASTAKPQAHNLQGLLSNGRTLLGLVR